MPRNCGHIREVAFGERAKYLNTLIVVAQNARFNISICCSDPPIHRSMSLSSYDLKLQVVLPGKLYSETAVVSLS